MEAPRGFLLPSGLPVVGHGRDVVRSTSNRMRTSGPGQRSPDTGDECTKPRGLHGGNTCRGVTREVETPISQPARRPAWLLKRPATNLSVTGTNHVRVLTLDSGLGQEELDRIR